MCFIILNKLTEWHWFFIYFFNLIYLIFYYFTSETETLQLLVNKKIYYVRFNTSKYFSCSKIDVL